MCCLYFVLLLLCVYGVFVNKHDIVCKVPDRFSSVLPIVYSSVNVGHSKAQNSIISFDYRDTVRQALYFTSTIGWRL